MSAVGLVSPAGVPEAGFLARLDSLLSSPSELDLLAERTRDPRMTQEKWLVALHLELLMLFNWAVRRTVASLGSDLADITGTDERVLVLLPSYGFALHALRRAVPFAVLGVETQVAIPPAHVAEATSVIGEVLAALGLTSLMTVSPVNPMQLVQDYTDRKERIFLTGRSETFTDIRAKHPASPLTGATGRCSVVLGSHSPQVVAVQNARMTGQLSISCSNYGCTLHTDSCADSAHATGVFGGRSYSGPLVDILRVIHPSVILVAVGDLHAPPQIGGYTVLSCTADGVPIAREGFGRDPIGGWPGDYCV